MQESTNEIASVLALVIMSKLFVFFFPAEISEHFLVNLDLRCSYERVETNTL